MEVPWPTKWPTEISIITVFELAIKIACLELLPYYTTTWLVYFSTQSSIVSSFPVFNVWIRDLLSRCSERCNIFQIYCLSDLGCKLDTYESCLRDQTQSVYKLLILSAQSYSWTWESYDKDLPLKLRKSEIELFLLLEYR